MRVTDIDWREEFVDKLQWKHRVQTHEVEEMLLDGNPRIKFARRGNISGEDVYIAYGRTESGRPLMAVYIHKLNGEALVISARTMTRPERRRERI